MRSASARLASVSSTASPRDADDLARQRAEARERKGVDLDDRILTDLDETDVEIGDQRLDLQRPLVGRHDQQLAAPWSPPGRSSSPPIAARRRRSARRAGCATSLAAALVSACLASSALRAASADLFSLSAMNCEIALNFSLRNSLSAASRLDQLALVGGQLRLRLLQAPPSRRRD